MKALTIVTLILLATACGKGGGGGQGQTSQSQNPVIKNCKAEVKKDDLLAVAVSANKVRGQCHLSEDETLEYVTKN